MRIQEHPFFESLSEENIARLAADAEIVEFEKDDVIFEEDSASTRLFLVLEGSVGFSKRIGENSFHPVSVSEAGEFFGEIGVLTGEPRSLRAHANSPVVLAALDRGQLEDFMMDSSAPLATTLRSVIHHLHHTTQQFMEEAMHREKMSVVGNMVNTIIHDFKNPVAYIRFAAEYIKRKHDHPMTQEICEKIEQQIDHMLEMADEVSLFSRGEYKPSFRPIRLTALMERFRELNYLFFENEAVTITIEIDEVEIEGEESKLIRVLQNLVDNALDALPESGEIRIEGRDAGDHLAISVSDNGSGIPEEIRETLFDAFVSRGKRRGTGLGTAIAKSIVEAHGGTISFETKTGEGTVFHIKLPKRQIPEHRQA